MGEIQLIRIKSAYGDLKGLLSQIPLAQTNSLVDEFLVDQLNQAIDSLTVVSGSDYSIYKIPPSKRLEDWNQKYPADIVRAQLGRVISKLELEYNFDKPTQSQTPGIVIFNKNENEISMKINYSINELIEKLPTEESKSKLKQLDVELTKETKNWDVIKNILIWIINFSKELFLEVIPIILQKKL